MIADTIATHYNQLFDTKDTAKDWSSSEQMRRHDELYHWGVVEGYNKSRREAELDLVFSSIPGACLSKVQPNVLQWNPPVLRLLRGLDLTKHPVLVQLPEN